MLRLPSHHVVLHCAAHLHRAIERVDRAPSVVLRPGIVLRAVDTRPTQWVAANVVVEDVVAVVPSDAGICFASFQRREVVVL